MEELKEAHFWGSSDMFKANPPGFLFLCPCHSPSSLVLFPPHHLSEVPTASARIVLVDFEILSAVRDCV